jgi:toxin ParE1/3/4
VKYSFHPEALKEYLGAIDFYSDIDTLLAGAFVDELEACMARIVTNPVAWQRLDDDVRRCLLKRFPFGVYYSVENNTICVYAVMHMSKQPDYWKHRIY